MTETAQCDMKIWQPDIFLALTHFLILTHFDPFPNVDPFPNIIGNTLC